MANRKKQDPDNKRLAKAKSLLLKLRKKNNASNPLRDSKNTPIVFTLDDVQAVLANKQANKQADKPVIVQAALANKIVQAKPEKQRTLQAVSVSDILGFNIANRKKVKSLREMEKVSPRFKPYFDILVALEKKVQGEIEEHAHDTLKHTDASGETAGNDMLNKDADSYDLDFALGIVTSEKLLLDEIEQAIDRIFDGSYGICEVTGKPIPKERLLAVPFTRCSLEGQKEQERKNAALRKKPVDEGVFTRDDDDDDIPLTYTEEESDL